MDSKRIRKSRILVDYQAIVGVGPIYDMHRYLMAKDNIKA